MTCGIRNFYLDEIDAWQAGKRATIGGPPEGERYALRMRSSVKLLERDLEQHVRTCEEPCCVADREYWTKRMAERTDP